MSKMPRALGVLLPVAVIAGLGYFGYYSLYIYSPSAHKNCANSYIGQQTDIAVHVIRQWAGKEGQTYSGCAESST